jgi:hypothetical protein
MVIFHSYVSLPEGIWQVLTCSRPFQTLFLCSNWDDASWHIFLGSWTTNQMRRQQERTKLGPDAGREALSLPWKITLKVTITSSINGPFLIFPIISQYVSYFPIYSHIFPWFSRQIVAAKQSSDDDTLNDTWLAGKSPHGVQWLCHDIEPSI